MMSLQILKPRLAPYANFGSKEKIVFCKRFKVINKSKDDDNQISNSEEPTESLFMKELKRRGINSTSLLEESNRSIYGDEEMKYKEERGYSTRNLVSADYEKSLTNQREQSMALNSEGLEGLIPRAKLLISIGASFFLGFWPLILVTVACFCAVYLYFGPAFIHDASTRLESTPPYVDPYALLEDERISQMASRVK